MSAGRQADRPDAEIVGWAVRAGTPGERETVFAEIYRRHGAAVVRRCASLLGEPLAAEDLAHETFEAAFSDLLNGRPPQQPEKLRAWLYGIARNRARQHWKDRAHYTELPEGDIEGDDWNTASKRRAAQVERLLNVVVATLTEREQVIYRYGVRDGLTGKDLAPHLGTDPVQASRLASETIKKVYEGFGALVLARDGRRYCPELAAILDAATWTGDNFTPLLRQRIRRHLDICKICDNCATCNRTVTELVRPYAPAIIPLLIAARLQQRIAQTIRRLTSGSPPRPPGGQPPPPPPQARRASRKRPRLARLALPAAALLAIMAIFAWRFYRHSPPPVLAAASIVPTIAYASPAGIDVRDGKGQVRTVAPVPAGGQVVTLAWSADGHHLGWLSRRNTQVSVGLANLTSGATHSWPCPSCAGLAFWRQQLISVTNGQGLEVFPQTGGHPTSATVSGLPAADPANPTLWGMTLVGSINSDNNILLFWNDFPPLKMRIELVDTSGHASPLFPGSAAVAPAGNIIISPDHTLLVYQGTRHPEGDICRPSDSVAIIDLVKRTLTTKDFPANADRPWRTTSAWIGGHTVFATAYQQPFDCHGSGLIPGKAVLIAPHIFKLGANGWIDTGQTALSGAVQGNWEAIGNGKVAWGSNVAPAASAPEGLAAISGSTQIHVSDKVTAFAFAPTPAPAPKPQASPSRSAALAATQILHVSAVNSQGSIAAGLTVTNTAGGANCEPASEAIGAAYRCFAGNGVYDPCWAQTQAATPAVLCLANPWTHDVTKLALTGKLPPLIGGAGSMPPWGLRLTDGHECVLEQGAHDSFAGRAVDYYCGSAEVVLRGLETNGPQWQAQTASYSSGQYTMGPARGISVAWFGIPER